MRGSQWGKMLAQGRAVIRKPDAPWDSASPPRLLPSPPLQKTSSLLLLLSGPSLLHSCISGRWRAKLLSYLPYSPKIMGQEGPCQPHQNHQEEAEKDDAGLHSWRGSERRDAEDCSRGEASSLAEVPSPRAADVLGTWPHSRR